MRYLSTRDPRPLPATHSFEEVLLAGLADDGGLYVPEALPQLDFAALNGLSYAGLAARIVGELPRQYRQPAAGTGATRFFWPANGRFSSTIRTRSKLQRSASPAL